MMQFKDDIPPGSTLTVDMDSAEVRLDGVEVWNFSGDQVYIPPASFGNEFLDGGSALSTYLATISGGTASSTLDTIIDGGDATTIYFAYLLYEDSGTTRTLTMTVSLMERYI